MSAPRDNVVRFRPAPAPERAWTRDEVRELLAAAALAARPRFAARRAEGHALADLALVVDPLGGVDVVPLAAARIAARCYGAAGDPALVALAQRPAPGMFHALASLGTRCWTDRMRLEPEPTAPG